MSKMIWGGQPLEALSDAEFDEAAEGVVFAVANLARAGGLTLENLQAYGEDAAEVAAERQRRMVVK